jgi:hypothetical protein
VTILVRLKQWLLIQVVERISPAMAIRRGFRQRKRARLQGRSSALLREGE